MVDEISWAGVASFVQKIGEKGSNSHLESNQSHTTMNKSPQSLKDWYSDVYLGRYSSFSV